MTCFFRPLITCCSFMYSSDPGWLLCLCIFQTLDDFFVCVFFRPWMTCLFMYFSDPGWPVYSCIFQTLDELFIHVFSDPGRPLYSCIFQTLDDLFIHVFFRPWMTCLFMYFSDPGWAFYSCFFRPWTTSLFMYFSNPGWPVYSCIFQTLDDLFRQCDGDSDGCLDEKELADLNARLYYMVPRLGLDYEGLSAHPSSLGRASSHISLIFCILRA